MTTRIALVGNPNSGKTTLFNQVTGTHQRVGNWPGVTVERKEGEYKKDKNISVIDLPGIYSLSTYSKEEIITRDYIMDEKPDVIINVVDASNLERNLYLTSQLLEFGTPVVIALNQMDVVKKHGDKIDAKALGDTLSVPVIEISALYGDGIDECIEKAVKAADEKILPAPRYFAEDIEKVIDGFFSALPDDMEPSLRRYWAVKTFAGDVEFPVPDEVLRARDTLTKDFSDSAENLIITERYNDISSLLDGTYARSSVKENISDKIDRVLTNRILALPIFIAIIFIIYTLSINTIGGIFTDWANDGVFGDGWYLGPGQEQLDEASAEYDSAQGFIDEFVAAAADKDVPYAEEIAKARANEEDVAGSTMSSFAAAAKTEDIQATFVPTDEETGELLEDESVTGGSEKFAEALTVVEPEPSSFGIWVPGIPVIVGDALTSIGCADWLYGLVIDGIIGGVGAVLGFVPQIAVLFFLLAILEGCGYMARVAFMWDRVFRRFGLSGKTFIPMFIATGCGVPAIMSSRTIESESARKLTVMTTTFMPCSAKLPIIALFAGAIFGGSGLVAVSAYFVGIFSIIISGIMLKKIKPFYGDTTPFAMELPEYRLPRFTDLLRSMWSRVMAFIKKAGTIILLSCILIWFLSNFGFVDGTFTMLTEDQMDLSLLAMLGGAICIIFAPLGWGNWQATAASVTGLIAKENLVGTLGVLYGGGAGLWANLAATYTLPAAASLMFFNLLCAPCFAAMGAIRRELGGGKWFAAAVGYECGYAYCFALCVYQIGSALSGNVNVIGLSVALLIISGVLFLLFRPDPSKKQDTVQMAAKLQTQAA